jgi:hypothetical protein
MPCSIEGCERKPYAKGICEMHRKRIATHGDPSVVKVREPITPHCSVEGCGRKHNAKGFCVPHYHRWRKYGNPLGKASRSQPGDIAIDHSGYRRAKTENDGWRQEHRLIMEGIIGRRLRRNETVHHKNGIRHDNHPNNLELWVKTQPAGQRASDLVEWAWSIILDYGGLTQLMKGNQGGPTPLQRANPALSHPLLQQHSEPPICPAIQCEVSHRCLPPLHYALSAPGGAHPGDPEAAVIPLPSGS